MEQLKACEHCGKELTKRVSPSGAIENTTHFRWRRFCNVQCSNVGAKRRSLKGPDNPGWKGDDASKIAKRRRAERLYPLSDCEHCGKPGVDRHHKDGNTGNNVPGNISILCRLCHMLEDGRLDRLHQSRRSTA